MKSGDAVEIYRVWAAQGYGKPPLYGWFGGYVFVRHESPNTVIVKQTQGELAGPELRYHRNEIRRA